MPRSEKQKEKLIRLLEYFISETDECHGRSMKEIISHLDSLDIRAERKSIYDDMLVLSELGFPIITLPEKPPKYTLSERPFELAELKLLVDAVESSKFITTEKSRTIIEKLRVFAGKYHSRELSRGVFVDDRIKTENDSTIENIDKIHKALNGSLGVSFKYFDYTKQKKKIYRHGGAEYRVLPRGLIWSEEKYYLVAYDLRDMIDKNFRVDKMDAVSLLDKIQPEESLKKFNPAKYSRKIFGMYGGREELVTFECKEHLASVCIDRFGEEPTFFPTEDGFRFSSRVLVSPTFFSWVMSFLGDMRIISPESVKKELSSAVDKIRESLEKN